MHAYNLEDDLTDTGPSQWDIVAPTIAEQHAQWHALHGTSALCPLDCGAGDHDPDEDDRLVRCGHCGGRHTVAGVRVCSRVHPMRTRLDQRVCGNMLRTLADRDSAGLRLFVCTLPVDHDGDCDMVDAIGMCLRHVDCRATREGQGDLWDRPDCAHAIGCPDRPAHAADLMGLPIWVSDTVLVPVIDGHNTPQIRLGRVTAIHADQSADVVLQVSGTTVCLPTVRMVRRVG